MPPGPSDLRKLWDVLYAVDASASMRDSFKPKSGKPFVKVEGVKEGIRQVMRAVPFPFESRVGVVAFRAPTKTLGMVLDSRRDIIQDLTGLVPASRLSSDLDAFQQKLDRLEVGGGTPTGEALLRGVQMLNSGVPETRPRIKKLVMVTDDKSNVGAKPETTLDAKLVRTVIVDVVSIGSTRDRRTFELLASRTGGKFSQVSTPTELAMALDPRIPYLKRPAPNPILEEAERVAEVLKETGEGSASRAGIEAAVGAVRERLEQKLQEAISLEGQARGELDMVVTAAMKDPKWPKMSMREYADRVWSRGADLSRFQTAAEDYRRALKSFPR